MKKSQDPSSAPTIGVEPRHLHPTERTEPKRSIPALPPYVDIAPLTRGGMGEILVGTDPRIGRRVAIKVALAEIESDSRQMARFRHEARITGRLEHPNIVPVHEAGETPDGRVYFSMKLVRGTTLGELLEERRSVAALQGHRFEPRLFLRQILRVCDALSFAHARGIVHRDLKPANIMVGAFGEVLVMDWGLARDLDRQRKTEGQDRPAVNFDPLKTLDGTIVGTPAYMPPEQAEGAIDRIDERSDIYALGAILYHIVTGSPPYDAESALSTIDLVREGHLPSPRKRAPNDGIPADLESLVQRAMARRKEDRYASVTELAADLEAFLEGHTLAAASYHPFQVLAKWTVRHRAVCTAVGAILFLVASLVGLDAWRDRAEAHRNHDQALTEARALLVDSTLLESLTRPRPIVDESTGLEFRESESRREERNTILQEYLRAARLYEAALRFQPGSTEALESRIEIGQATGRMAMAGNDLLLAREAFARLEEFGLPPERIEPLLEEVDRAENRMLGWRKLRLRQILDDIGAGLARDDRPPGAPDLDAYVDEALGYRDLQTIEIVAEDLGQITLRHSAPDRASDWSSAERDRARFDCRILGRIHLIEALEPLADWLAALTRARTIDDDLVLEAGRALCQTKRPEAIDALLAARQRLSGLSRLWEQIERDLGPILEKAASATPRSSYEFYVAAHRHRVRGESQEAIDAFSRAIELDPGSTTALLDRAQIRGLNDIDAATVDLDRILQIDPDHLLAHLTRGLLRRRRHDIKSAIDDFTRALEIAPSNILALRYRAATRMDRQEWDLALPDLDLIVDLNHFDPDPLDYLRRGRTYLNLDRLEEAGADLDQAIEIDPKMARAYGFRGDLRVLRGDLPGAGDDYDRGIELSPRNTHLLGNRGTLRLLEGNPQGALDDLEYAIKYDPLDWKFWRDMGRARLLLRQPQRARTAFERAQELAPAERKVEIADFLDRVRRRR